ncbi:MAG: hypothetical protein J07HB67_01795 [halophilic archaeon J07HB67]|nr:MAG: hypothetical protein J07HB67_01795 [halophilic archaeon J07HB67]
MSTASNNMSISSVVTPISPSRTSSNRSSIAWANPENCSNPIAAAFPFRVCAVRKIRSIASGSSGSASRSNNALFRSVIPSSLSRTNVLCASDIN